MTSRRVPTPAQHVEVAYLDGDAVLYDTAHARPVMLNHTAALVWAALDGIQSVEEIAAELVIRCGAEPSQVNADVTAAIASFDELGLLKRPRGYRAS